MDDDLGHPYLRKPPYRVLTIPTSQTLHDFNIHLVTSSALALAVAQSRRARRSWTFLLGPGMDGRLHQGLYFGDFLGFVFHILVGFGGIVGVYISHFFILGG